MSSVCVFYYNRQVVILFYTNGVFLSSLTALAFTEPPDYLGVFAIQKARFWAKIAQKRAKCGLAYASRWSRRRDSNPRPYGPEPYALPTALHLDLFFNFSYSTEVRISPPPSVLFAIPLPPNTDII